MLTPGAPLIVIVTIGRVIAKVLDCGVPARVRYSFFARMTGSLTAQLTAAFSVALSDDETRTQNGHIRNDTRDISRRITAWPDGPICRRKRVASDRGCTRVTRGNLHGKEGVDGSSPSEGSLKRPANGLFCCLDGVHTSLERPSTCPQELSPTLQEPCSLGLSKGV